MISILIANNNISNIKTIINALSNNKEINVDYIAVNDKETINAITKLRPNLVILDFMLKNSHPFEILNYVAKKHLDTKFIAINVDKNNYYSKLRSYNNIVIKISRSSNLDNIAESIYKYDNNKQIIEKKIIKELQEIGYSVTHKGTIFLAEIIEMLIGNEEYEEFNLKKDLYPVIAKKHKTTINSVKLDIFNATESMYCNCKMTKFYDYFHIETKPNIKYIIFTIYKNIKEIKS